MEFTIDFYLFLISASRNPGFCIAKAPVIVSLIDIQYKVYLYRAPATILVSSHVSHLLSLKEVLASLPPPFDRSLPLRLKFQVPSVLSCLRSSFLSTLWITDSVQKVYIAVLTNKA